MRYGRREILGHELLADAKAAFADFLQSHWAKIWSNNPTERLDRETQAPHRRGWDLPQPGRGRPGSSGPS